MPARISASVSASWTARSSTGPISATNSGWSFRKVNMAYETRPSHGGESSRCPVVSSPLPCDFPRFTAQHSGVNGSDFRVRAFGEGEHPQREGRELGYRCRAVAIRRDEPRNPRTQRRAARIHQLDDRARPHPKPRGDTGVKSNLAPTRALEPDAGDDADAEPNGAQPLAARRSADRVWQALAQNHAVRCRR